MNIKPGCICLLRNLPAPMEWNGRTVTAVRFNPAAFCMDWNGRQVVAAVWVIAAPWMPLTYSGGNWQVFPAHLVPLSDPDLSETLEDRLREYTV